MSHAEQARAYLAQAVELAKGGAEERASTYALIAIAFATVREGTDGGPPAQEKQLTPEEAAAIGQLEALRARLKPDAPTAQWPGQPGRPL